MAKLSAIQKNLKRVKLVNKYSSKRSKLKKICCDKSLSIEERFNAQLKLSECPRNGAKIRLRNRCEVTGRPRGFYRKFKGNFIESGPADSWLAVKSLTFY